MATPEGQKYELFDGSDRAAREDEKAFVIKEFSKILAT